jgi:two-component system LytT family response regulator
VSRTVLIVEDEQVAAETLRDYLEAVDDFRCAGVARTGPEAAQALDEREPDVVLLDVELPGLSGVEVLLRADHDPAVIFTTAYDRHAVTAFELGAFDYLVKPFGPERFEEALERLRSRLDADPDGRPDSPPASRRAATALDRDGEDEHLMRLFVRSSADEIVPVHVDDVIRLEASGDYVRIHVDGDSHLVSLSMSEFERRLDPSRFLRVHRSHMVNVDRVERVEKHDDRRLRLHLSDGSEVVASRSGSRALRDRAV